MMRHQHFPKALRVMLPLFATNPTVQAFDGCGTR